MGVRRSVSRVLSHAVPWSAPWQRQGDGHSSGTLVAERLLQPTQATVQKRILCRPYSVLLPVGFSLPPRVAAGAVRSYRTLSSLPAPWRGQCWRAVCFLCHFPWGCPRQALPGTVFPWSPDFPPPAGFPIAKRRPSDRLTLDSHHSANADAPPEGRASLPKPFQAADGVMRGVDGCHFLCGDLHRFLGQAFGNHGVRVIAPHQTQIGALKPCLIDIPLHT